VSKPAKVESDFALLVFVHGESIPVRRLRNRWEDNALKLISASFLLCVIALFKAMAKFTIALRRSIPLSETATAIFQPEVHYGTANTPVRVTVIQKPR
jgi:hypothetical protein